MVRKKTDCLILALSVLWNETVATNGLSYSRFYLHFTSGASISTQHINFLFSYLLACHSFYFQVITAYVKPDQIEESVHRGVSNWKQPLCCKTQEKKFDQNIYPDPVKILFICVKFYVSCYSHAWVWNMRDLDKILVLLMFAILQKTEK